MPERLGWVIAMLLCSVVPALLFCSNLWLYRPPPLAREGSPAALPQVSVLIPARDEAQSIGAALASVLHSTGAAFEVVVMDDASSDGTAEIVRAVAATDARVRLEQAPPLRPGWSGKQHACWALAHTARYPLLCFLDADVRLEPAALARMVAFLEQTDAALVSGFPREQTGTWLEWMLLPLIHFVLLGFLPMAWMRAGARPGFAAGCGQFLLVRREEYFACGGHAAIRETMHDGLRLPRLFREHGCRTDLADLTGLAACRMYRNASEVWHGLAKNATEGIADPVRIVPLSALLLLGQVLPFACAAWFAISFAGGFGASGRLWGLVLVAVVAAWLPRVLAAVRFRQDWRSVLLHPVGIVLLLAVQWYALARKLSGGRVRWKQRAYVGQ